MLSISALTEAQRFSQDECNQCVREAFLLVTNPVKINTEDLQMALLFLILALFGSMGDLVAAILTDDDLRKG